MNPTANIAQFTDTALDASVLLDHRDDDLNTDVWKHTITVQSLDSISSQEERVNLRKDGILTDSIRNVLQQDESLMHLKKQLFVKKPILFYNIHQNTVYASVHLLTFKNWTVSKRILFFDFNIQNTVDDIDTNCDDQIDNPRDLSIDVFMPFVESKLNMYQSHAANNEDTVDSYTTLRHCIFVYYRTHVHEKQHQQVCDQIECIRQQSQVYQTKHTDLQTQHQKDIHSIHETLNEWMDDCDARFAGLFTTLEMLSRNVKSIDDEHTTIQHNLCSLVKTKTQLTQTIEDNSKQLEYQQQQWLKDSHQLQICISNLQRSQEKMAKDIQNEKWMLTYFACITIMTLFIPSMLF